jgi:hypothetical protein
MNTGRVFELAAALGRRNQEIIELARRHCTHMHLPEWELDGRAPLSLQAATTALRAVTAPERL